MRLCNKQLHGSKAISYSKGKIKLRVNKGVLKSSMGTRASSLQAQRSTIKYKISKVLNGCRKNDKWGKFGLMHRSEKISQN